MTVADDFVVALVGLRPCMGVVLSRLIESVLPIFSEPRGARHETRCLAPQPCIRLGPHGIQTMKQTFASGARLRSGRPILPTASKPGRSSGHRHLGSALTACRNVVTGRQRRVSCWTSCSHSRSQHDTSWDFADCHQAPERDQQLSGERHDHRRLARTPSGSSPVPLRQPAILLEHQESPSELDHNPRRTRALPALASPFSRRLEPLSSGDPVKPA